MIMTQAGDIVAPTTPPKGLSGASGIEGARGGVGRVTYI